MPARAERSARPAVAPRALLRAAAALLAGLLLLPSARAAEPAQVVGSAGCAAGTCHGAVTPWQGARVLHDEFTTWQRLDPHAQAYAVLSGEQGRRIAARMGVGAATQAAQCLACHAPPVPAALAGTRHRAADGVGCEDCHGAAGNWLDSHAAPGATHAGNLARGLYPTEDPAARARLCAGCHAGGAGREATHALFAAGHPRLVYEPATFSALLPPHWVVDDDWRARKGSDDALRLWAQGQLLGARRWLERLAQPARAGAGQFPDPALYDCHACHHPHTRSTDRTPPPARGRLQPADSHLLMVQALAHALQPGEAAAFDAAVAQLLAALDRDDATAAMLADAARALAARVARVEAAVAARGLDARTARALLDALVAQQARLADYADAEQAYMAAAILAGMRDDARTRAQLARLAALLADENDFRPQAFAASLAALRDLLQR